MLTTRLAGLLVFTCWLGLAVSLPAADRTWDVFLLIGQSNMDGRGKTADLDPAGRQPLENAILYYRNPPVASAGWQPLAPGFGVPPGHRGGLPAPTFGPEIGFARAWRAARPGSALALIKAAKGGTSLVKDWQPGQKNQPETQGPCYRNFLATYSLALGALTNDGSRMRLRAVLWHQGESDAKDTAALYQQKLTAFVARLREDLQQPQAPFLIGEVFDNQKRDGVRAGQRAAASAIPHAYFVPADGLKTWDEGTHFDAPSQLILGARFAQAILAAGD